MTELTPFVIAWASLVLVIIGLALYRRTVASHEDNYVHLDDAEARQIPAQVAVSNKLEAIDRVGKALTVLAAASGMAMAAYFLYAGWTRNL